MRLRYRKEKEFKNVLLWDQRLPGYNLKITYRSQKKISYTQGILIFESEPQIRTMLLTGNAYSVRLPLPYLLHTVSYLKIDYKYIYPGVLMQGLRVYCRNEPFTSLSDPVGIPPTDYGRMGVVCTNHAYDYKIYDSLKELVSEAIGLWWGTNHFIEFCSERYKNYHKKLNY